MSIRGLAAASCLAVAAISFGNGLWITMKAELAQILIERSWERSATIKPWPWADTWPVARLSIKHEQLFVLSGSHGSALAFGPGHVDGTALPGTAGTSVIGGHRDTHFKALREVGMGDIISVQSLDRIRHDYVIDRIHIVDTRLTPAMSVADDLSRIVLVTCYPFDALTAGGPLRYVVEAQKKEPVSNLKPAL